MVAEAPAEFGELNLDPTQRHQVLFLRAEQAREKLQLDRERILEARQRVCTFTPEINAKAPAGSSKVGTPLSRSAANLGSVSQASLGGASSVSAGAGSGSDKGGGHVDNKTLRKRHVRNPVFYRNIKELDKFAKIGEQRRLATEQRIVERQRIADTVAPPLDGAGDRGKKRGGKKRRKKKGGKSKPGKKDHDGKGAVGDGDHDNGDEEEEEEGEDDGPKAVGRVSDQTMGITGVSQYLGRMTRANKARQRDRATRELRSMASPRGSPTSSVADLGGRGSRRRSQRTSSPSKSVAFALTDDEHETQGSYAALHGKGGAPSPGSPPLPVEPRRRIRPAATPSPPSAKVSHRRPPPDLLVEVKVNAGKIGRVALRRGDDPAVVAGNFAKTYGLPEAKARRLTKVLDIHLARLEQEAEEKRKAAAAAAAAAEAEAAEAEAAAAAAAAASARRGSTSSTFTDISDDAFVRRSAGREATGGVTHEVPSRYTVSSAALAGMDISSSSDDEDIMAFIEMSRNRRKNIETGSGGTATGGTATTDGRATASVSESMARSVCFFFFFFFFFLLGALVDYMLSSLFGCFVFGGIKSCADALFPWCVFVHQVALGGDHRKRRLATCRRRLAVGSRTRWWPTRAVWRAASTAWRICMARP